MSMLRKCLFVAVSVVLAGWTLFSSGPVAASGSAPQVTSPEEAAIRSTIDAYIKLKYEGLHTLTLQDYSGLISDLPDARAFLQSEVDKQEIEIRHAVLKRLRYVRYEYFLDNEDVHIDATAGTASAHFTEGHNVVFEQSDPVISSMHNLEHVMTLAREDGQWKIVSDHYEDYLWRLLRTTGASKQEVLQRIEQTLDRPRGLMGSDGTRTAARPETPQGTLGTYNWSGALDYAHQWAYGRNPAYYDFSGLGGDCTNFVSQAMHEGGGIPETASGGGVGAPGWYYVSINDRAAAWNDVGALYDFMVNGHFWSGGPEAIEQPTESYMYEGDIIQYEWGDGWPWDHSVIVVDVVQISPTYWYPLVAAHSDDMDNYPFDFRDYGGIRFLHVTGY